MRRMIQHFNVKTGHRMSLSGAKPRCGSAASLWAHLVNVGCIFALGVSCPGLAQTPAPATDAGLEIQNDIPSLQQVFSGYFTIGAAIWPGDISGPHSELLKKHFNSITAENAMKWAVIEPTEGDFNFAPADAL